MKWLKITSFVKGRLVFLFLCSVSSTCVADLSADKKLALVVQHYELKGCEKTLLSERGKLGKELFESTLLSGDYDTSCSDCHQPDFGLTDGLPMAIGVGGSGQGSERLNSNGVVVPRNAFSLFARGSPAFTSFFWDGKVETDGRKIFSPFGDLVSSRFDSALAVASSLPFTERDEFLGQTHNAVENDLISAVENQYYQEKYTALSLALEVRLKTDELGVQVRDVFDYKENERFELADVANLIAVFIREEFGCFESRWNEYLKGDLGALQRQEKAGALLFFGKARCSGCHSGELFSDFRFHSLGIPQGSFGPHTRKRDIGRAAVTNSGRDLYKFRTPPLIAVSETAPYGHNGMFESLEEVVLYHVNPVPSLAEQSSQKFSKDYFEVGQLLATRDERLKYLDIDSERELTELLAFLKTL